MTETNIVRRRERSGTETQAKSSVLMDAELGVITDEENKCLKQT